MNQKKETVEINETFDFVVASQKPVQHRTEQERQQTNKSQQHPEFWI